MYSFVVTNNRNRDIERVLAFEGQSQVVEFDLSPWEDVNGSVTAVTWTLKSGSAGISSESLSSSVASALITTNQSGRSMIKVSLTAGSNTEILHFEVFAKDPQVVTEDYGFEYR